MSLRTYVCAVLLLLGNERAALAHGTSTVSVDVTETAPGKAIVHVRTNLAAGLAGLVRDPQNGQELPIRAVFDAPCESSMAGEEGSAVTLVECPGSLAGARITVEGLGPILAEAIVVVSLSDGRRVSRVVIAGEPSFTLPPSQSGLSLARAYVRMGIAHILTGYDHLLFLVSLVLLLKSTRAVLLAETAFTLSHSLSFSATALGVIQVWAPAAEAAIALSLVLVALDIKPAETFSCDSSMPHSNRPTKEGTQEGKRQELAIQSVQGAKMAFVFGLVHGLGFAGGLKEVGLPDHDASLALIGFATGVEVGQVAFLIVVLSLLYAAARPLARIRYEPVAALAIGGISTYWLIERTLVCLRTRG